MILIAFGTLIGLSSCSEIGTASAPIKPSQQTETSSVSLNPTDPTTTEAPTAPPFSSATSTDSVATDLKVREVRLQSEDYVKLLKPEKEGLIIRYPMVFLQDGFICSAGLAEYESKVGGTYHPRKLLKIDLNGNITEIGQYNCFSENSCLTSDGQSLLFAVVEAVSEQEVYQGHYTNVIYKVDLNTLALEEIYRSNAELPEFYMALQQNSLIIRQAKRDGEKYTTWLEQYDLSEKRIVARSEEYVSVNGIGRYLLNVNVDQGVVYGLLTERDRADDAHETPSIIVYNEKLEEVERIDCSSVKDYLIHTYPQKFCVRNDTVYVKNGNNMEVLVAINENGVLKEIFRKQSMNFQIPWTSGQQPLLFSSEDEGIFYCWDPLSESMQASHVLFEGDNSVPAAVWQADNASLLILYDNRMGYAIVDCNNVFPDS